MTAKVKASGRYDLFEDPHGHRFLDLAGKGQYVWIEGQKSPIIVRSRRRHEKKRDLQHGRYLLVDFEDDPDFRDLPHLFLQKGDRYREFVLPNGLPTDRDPQKRLVVTRKALSAKKLEKHLHQAA
jgi:hypothetical protein